MKIPFIVFLLLGFFGTARVMGQQQTDQSATCVNCIRPPAYLTPPVPQVIYRPQTVMVPYRHAGTSVTHRQYATPLRSLFLGQYRINHYYRPMVQQ